MREQVQTAVAGARRACALLVSPSGENLERCAGILEEATAGFLTEIRGACGPGASGVERQDPALVALAHELRAEVRVAGRLLDQARDYYAGWNQLLGCLSGGYTARGEAAPVARSGRVWLTG